LNLRPPVPQTGARTKLSYIPLCNAMVGRAGLEPAETEVGGFTARCTSRYATDPWCTERVSNPRHPVCKTGALPSELPVHNTRSRQSRIPGTYQVRRSGQSGRTPLPAPMPVAPPGSVRPRTGNRTPVSPVSEARSRPLNYPRMVRPAGLEPTAYRFGTCRSVHLSYGRMTGTAMAPGPGLEPGSAGSEPAVHANWTIPE
jgi:hypothetical protein